MANLCLLHVCSSDEIFLSYGADMVSDFTRVAEKYLWGCLETRLRQDVQVRAVAEQIVADNLVVRWASQALRHFSQVGQLLRDVTEALINGAESFIASSFPFFVSLLGW